MGDDAAHAVVLFNTHYMKICQKIVIEFCIHNSGNLQDVYFIFIMVYQVTKMLLYS